MIGHLVRVFGWRRDKPLTFADVAAERQDPAQEEAARRATAKLVGEVMKLERKSWELRQGLAGGVIDIVSGEQQ